MEIKKHKKLLIAVSLIMLLIYRNISLDNSSNNMFLLLGMIIVIFRMIFFKISLKQSNLYVVLLGIVGFFFSYIYSYPYINDIILINYITLASIFSFLNISLMSYLVYKNEKIIGSLYLLNSILVSIELIPKFANIVEILALLVYIILSIKIGKVND